MARKTNNRIVTNLDNGKKRVDATRAPAIESENARLDQVGPFRKANLSINLAAVAATAGGVDSDAPTSVIAGRGGVIIGIAYQFSAAISAGGATAATLQAAVGPAGGALVAQGDAFAVPSAGAQSAILDETAGSIKKGLEKGGIPFLEGDLLGVLVSTNGTFAPTTDDVTAYLIVRWNV